jgi:hypothetical protein
MAFLKAKKVQKGLPWNVDAHPGAIKVNLEE